MAAEELFRGIDCTKPPATDKLWELCEARLDGRRDKIGRYYFPTVFFATDRRWV